jgi:membrane-bound lytic murein transglycosylase D
MRRLFVFTILLAAFTLSGCMLNFPVQQDGGASADETTAESPAAKDEAMAEEEEQHQFNLFRYLMAARSESTETAEPAPESIDTPSPAPAKTVEAEEPNSGPNPFSLVANILSTPPTVFAEETAAVEEQEISPRAEPQAVETEEKPQGQNSGTNPFSLMANILSKPPTDFAEKSTGDTEQTVAPAAKTEDSAPETEQAVIPRPSEPKPQAKPALAKKRQVVVEPAVNPLEHIATVPTPSLWQRMRKSFRLSLPENEPRLKKEIRWLEKRQSHINKIRQRATPYLYFIVKEIESRGMPMELALMPAVESTYLPFAYSHGRAAGLWQFIPSTGKRFGLEQNWWYDGRRDVVASTRAALNYLSKLNRQFDGDWELTLAAYNAGSGNVRKAIRKNRKKGKATGYRSLDLPPETRRYIPRLLALAEVIKHPVKHRLQLGYIANKPYFDTIGIGSQLDIALAAEMAGIPVDELYRLNPGLNRWATPPDGPHRLSIPARKVKTFKAKLAELSPDQRVQWKRYKIRSGDTLSVIAENHGTTTRILRQVNKITGSGIRAGKYLLIPTASKNLNQYGLTSEERNKKTKSRKRKGIRKEHVVKSGENFWDIARLYQVNYRSLAKWNGMAPRDTLRSGQKLVVWLPETEENRRLAAPLDLRPPSGKSPVYYRVRQGDSLSTIASRFQVRVADLKRWNTLSGKYLQPGQKLVLYVDVTEQSL